MSELSLFIPITKIDRERQEVIGVIAEERLDKSMEIMDYASSKPYFKAWSDAAQKRSFGKSYGNVREMHDKNRAAGLLKAIEFNDDGRQIEVRSRVVDPVAWQKCDEGVYTGFSVGGGYAKRWTDPQTGATRYTALPSEVSLVDNPCMYGATFRDLVKGVDVEFPKHDEPSPAALILVPELKKYIRKEGDKFVVYSEAGKKLGEHEERDDAESQLRAIEANKHGGGMSKSLALVESIVGSLQKVCEFEVDDDLGIGAVVGNAKLQLSAALTKAAQQVAADLSPTTDATEAADADLNDVLTKLHAALTAGGSAMDTDKIVSDVMSKLAPQIEAAVTKSTGEALAKIAQAGVEQATAVGELRKIATEQGDLLNKRHEETQAGLKKLADDNAAQAARIERLEKAVVVDPKRPAASENGSAALSKSGEQGHRSTELTPEQLEKMAPDERALALCKQQLGKPFIIDRASIPAN